MSSPDSSVPEVGRSETSGTFPRDLAELLHACNNVFLTGAMSYQGPTEQPSRSFVKIDALRPVVEIVRPIVDREAWVVDDETLDGVWRWKVAESIQRALIADLSRRTSGETAGEPARPKEENACVVNQSPRPDSSRRRESNT